MPNCARNSSPKSKSKENPTACTSTIFRGDSTLTGRASPQAFQVIPVMVYRVYADGRPDELVRGVDIVGTPLLSLNNIVLTGDTPQVFNGICGAESGQVPVAAAAPAIDR